MGLPGPKYQLAEVLVVRHKHAILGNRAGQDRGVIGLGHRLSNREYVVPGVP
jgi:hypothetical protein